MNALSPAAPLAIVTGAAAGLGLAASRALARQGYDLLLLDRDAPGGQKARDRLLRESPNQAVQFVDLDLADPTAIAAFAGSLQHRSVDLLMNNAGLFPTFNRRENAQGCELGLAVSFYGHFALTARLLPNLLRASVPRVVTVSSIAHAGGRLDSRDPLLAQDYDASRAYNACKLACLLFARELHSQARQHRSHLRSIAAHPGIARTQIGQYRDNPATRPRHRAIGWATRIAMRYFGQDVEQGAAALVFAATEATLQGGEFVGPGGLFQFRGPPRVVQPRGATLARHDADAIWRMAEEYTGLQFAWPGTTGESIA